MFSGNCINHIGVVQLPTEDVKQSYLFQCKMNTLQGKAQILQGKMGRKDTEGSTTQAYATSVSSFALVVAIVC